MGEICALALIAALSYFLLSELKWRGAPVIAVLFLVGVLTAALPYARQLGSAIDSLAELEGVADGAEAVLKIIGIGYLAGICADVCTELGVPRVASAVNLVGRLEIIAVAGPFFIGILDMGMELIG